MMNDKVSGYVLNRYDYKENDVIIKVLTQEYGIISLVVRGAKKSRSKNNYATLQFSKSEFIFNYRENKNIFNLISASIIKDFNYDDLLAMTLASLFTEVLTKVYIEDNYKEYYDLLAFSLEHLKVDEFLIASLFIATIAKYLGYSAQVDNCSGCQSLKIVNISNQLGGFVCSNCNTNDTLVPVDNLKKFRYLNKIDYSKYDNLKKFNYDNFDFILMMDFFLYQTDLKINSYELLKSII